MEDPNPYRAPDAVVADVGSHGDHALATLLERFLGALLDGLISLVIVLPIMFATGYFQGAMSGDVPGFGTQLLYIAMGFAIFCLVQGYPLAQSGQTWGKRVMKTRIVGMDGSQPPLGALLGKRYLPVQLVAAIPLVGNVLVIVDALFVFRSDRRCVHDLIAGTQVVKAG